VRPLRVKLVQYAILALIVIVPLVSYIVRGSNDDDATVAYTELVKAIEQGRVTDTTIQGDVAMAHTQDGQELRAYVPPRDASFFPLLNSHNVTIRVRPDEPDLPWRLVVFWAPTLAIVSVLIYFLSSIDAALRINAEKLDELRKSLAASGRTNGGITQSGKA